MTDFEQEKKQLEQEKEKLKQEREVVKLRQEVNEMKKQTTDYTGVKKFGKMWLGGAKKVGRGLLKVGERISESNINEAMGVGTKKKNDK